MLGEIGNSTESITGMRTRFMTLRNHGSVVSQGDGLGHGSLRRSIHERTMTALTGDNYKF